jgi:DsbC/DsbD-like thiol-disulfide interchange protein
MLPPALRPVSGRAARGIITLKHSLLAMAALCAAACPSVLAAQPGQMNVSFAAESETPTPGKTTMLVLKMQPKAGWHGYWRNPGQSGGPMRLRWTAPKGVKFGEPLWAAPIAQQSMGLTNYIMPGAYSLLVPMTVPKDMALGTSFAVSMDMLLFVCTEGMCSSQKVEGSVDLVAGVGEPSTIGGPMVTEARRAIPKQVKATAIAGAGETMLSLQGAGLDPARTRIFLADSAAPVDAQKGPATRAGGKLSVSLKWQPAGPFEGVASDGVNAVSFVARPQQAVIADEVDHRGAVVSADAVEAQPKAVLTAAAAMHDDAMPKAEPGKPGDEPGLPLGMAVSGLVLLGVASSAFALHRRRIG